jgi:hypothetical protein
VEDVKLTLKTRSTSGGEKVNFIISHLGGPAREEVRYRSAAEKKRPQDVLGILKEVFGDRGTVSEIFANFYQCQQEDESLQGYSHRLMCKLDRIYRKEDKAILN